jgi:hypothetical protein
MADNSKKTIASPEEVITPTVTKSDELSEKDLDHASGGVVVIELAGRPPSGQGE